MWKVGMFVLARRRRHSYKHFKALVQGQFLENDHYLLLSGSFDSQKMILHTSSLYYVREIKRRWIRHKILDSSSFLRQRTIAYSIHTAVQLPLEV